MGMLGSTVLCVLGGLAAEEPLTRLRPGLRAYIGLFSPFSGPLGVGATAYGLYTILWMLAYLGFVRYAPTVFFIGLASGLVSLSLGLIFGLKTAQRWIGPDGFLGKTLGRAEPLSRLLARYKTALGLAGVALGVLSAALNLFV